ncbi:growth arrest-specific protein 1-like [Venturia canescens]|uniref:growth arrest-specific protein 1-like n=1 Tax=Venturia canescens TaxID=32260 RepID=UPI001C9C180D|nr:growth arrest-specific protein 1-like [Venturia canescens]
MSRGAKALYALVLSTLISFVRATTNSSVNTAKTSCEVARLRCAFRTGCGSALQQYLTSCTADLQSDSRGCPETCQHALIALTSTDQGKELMSCDCPDDDYLCNRSKQRVEICRSSVTMAMNRTRVSCRTATWICNADALCSKALDYYNAYCRSMFHGKKCTPRCRNSIGILSRQEKAAKLNTCLCDGAEEYDCKGIHRNMNYLCFGKIHHDYHEVKKLLADTRTNEVKRMGENSRGSSVRSLVNRTMLIFTLVLLLLTSKD